MNPPSELAGRLRAADKPAGCTTHSSLNENERKKTLADSRDGFVEYLEDRMGERLFVCHRLDRETTGAILFARDAETAATLHELFASRKVQKRYLFLTDRERKANVSATSSEPPNEFTIESFIERRGGAYVSIEKSEATPANARTHFKLLASDHALSLWEAKPETGKPHQIRLHAETAGISILGDKAHGGSSFPALCLHSAEIRVELDGAVFEHSAPAPLWFKRRELAEDHALIKWLTAADRRSRLLRSLHASGTDANLTQRWIHSEGDPLRAEQLGGVQWLSWYDDADPSTADLRRISTLAELLDWRRWYLQVRGNRGRAPNDEKRFQGHQEIPPSWTALENGAVFEFRSNQGLSPGLFLDQRRNRAWVHTHSLGKNVLNLFCYTGGFSVAAALGGAAKTVSIDVSKTFLEWAKANFTHNSLALDGHEFRAMDSRDYLEWAKKKGLQFDLVICDPPSFGRSKSGVFSIEKDFAALLEALIQVTAPGGRILFSSNFERWTIDEFAERTLSLARAKKWSVRLEPAPSPDWDFELPRVPRNMKSFFIIRA